jgi:uncharacterized protein (TIGR03066 family)
MTRWLCFVLATAALVGCSKSSPDNKGDSKSESTPPVSKNPPVSEQPPGKEPPETQVISNDPKTPADAKDNKSSENKLLGKWSLTDGQIGKATLEFDKDGGVRMARTASGNEIKLEGKYTHEGNKLTIIWKIRGQEVKTTRTISKLTDTEFVSKDDNDGQVDSMIRLKENDGKQADVIKDLEWKIGSIGGLPQKKGMYYNVFRVVAPGEVLVLPMKLAGTAGGGTQEVDDGPPVLVKGITTTGLKARSPIVLEGKFKVTGEHVLNGNVYGFYDGSSIWVVKLQK